MCPIKNAWVKNILPLRAWLNQNQKDRPLDVPTQSHSQLRCARPHCRSGATGWQCRPHGPHRLAMTHVQQRNATACSVMPTSASTAFGRSVTDALAIFVFLLRLCFATCSTVAMKLELSNDIEKLALMKKRDQPWAGPLVTFYGSTSI